MKDSGIEWIGEIPISWRVNRYKNICSILNGFPFDSTLFDNSSGTPLIRIRDITSGSIETFYLGDYDEKYIVKSGDILVGMDGDFNIRKWANSDALLNQRCMKITPNTNFSGSFLYYQLPYVLKIINDLTYSTTVKHLSHFSVLNSKIVVPNSKETERIVKYLENIVSEIDSIIEKTKQSIEEYKKYKQSLITEVVTKGLNKNVKMKDSGIEWIGEIPEHWDLAYLPQVYSQVKQKNTIAQEENLLSLSYGQIIRKNIKTNDGLLPENFEGYNIVEKNDIVLRLTDLQNDHKSLRVGLVTERGIITSAYVTIRSKIKVNNEYMFFLIYSFDICKGFYGLGSGVRQNLTFDGIKSFKFILPPSDEQDEIVKIIKGKTIMIDNLIEVKENLLSELESYKKSLIYEVVTGKKEIN